MPNFAISVLLNYKIKQPRCAVVVAQKLSRIVIERIHVFEASYLYNFIGWNIIIHTFLDEMFPSAVVYQFPI